MKSLLSCIILALKSCSGSPHSGKQTINIIKEGEKEDYIWILQYNAVWLSNDIIFIWFDTIL